MPPGIRPGGKHEPWQIDCDGGGQRWAAALEDAYIHPAWAGRKGQSQDRRRRLADKAVGAQQDEGGGVFFGSQLQAAQGAHVGIGQPQQDDVAGAGSKGLTRGPAGMGRAGRLDEEQAREGHPGGGQGRGIEGLGRGDADRPAPRRDTGQQRQQQAELTDPGVGQEELGEGIPRPATAGQHGIQPGMAGGQPRSFGLRQPIAAPHQAFEP